MANKLQYLSQITTGQTIQATHISQLINALSGSEAYDLTVSGSLTVIGTLAATASWATNAISANSATSATTATTASHAITARSSSFASTASFVQTAQTASYVASTTTLTGASYPSGSPAVPTAGLKMVVGSGKTGNPTPEYAVNITQIAGKTLGTDCFVTATVSGSGASTISVKSLVATTLTFETQAPDTPFHYHIVYI